MNTVAQILSLKGSNTVTVPVGTTVLDALKIMAEKNIGSVVVTDAEGHYKGIVSERFILER